MDDVDGHWPARRRTAAAQAAGLTRKASSGKSRCVSNLAAGRARHCLGRRSRQSQQRPPPSPHSSRPRSHGAPSLRPPGAGRSPSPPSPVPLSFAPAFRLVDSQHGGDSEKGTGRPCLCPEGFGSGSRDREEAPWPRRREGRCFARK